MKYRIVEIVKREETRFIAQYRFLWFFWFSKRHRGWISGWWHITEYHSIDDAIADVEAHANDTRRVVWPPPRTKKDDKSW